MSDGTTVSAGDVQEVMVVSNYSETVTETDFSLTVINALTELNLHMIHGTVALEAPTFGYRKAVGCQYGNRQSDLVTISTLTATLTAVRIHIIHIAMTTAAAAWLTNLDLLPLLTRWSSFGTSIKPKPIVGDKRFNVLHGDSTLEYSNSRMGHCYFIITLHDFRIVFKALTIKKGSMQNYLL